MKKTDILSRLCYYDNRNPYYNTYLGEEKKPDCACDNCFYGRDELANYTLELLDRLRASLGVIPYGNEALAISIVETIKKATE